MCNVVMCDVVMLNVSVEIELVIVSAAWLTNYLFIRVGVNKNNLIYPAFIIHSKYFNVLVLSILLINVFTLGFLNFDMIII